MKVNIGIEGVNKTCKSTEDITYVLASLNTCSHLIFESILGQSENLAHSNQLLFSVAVLSNLLLYPVSGHVVVLGLLGYTVC